MSDETTAKNPLSDVEERDLKWLREVYQGDHQRQLTWRAVLTGGVLGMLLSVSNLYTTLKLGWGFGVAITACVISYVLWNAMRTLTGGRLSQMSMLENNCMASAASSAGMSTGGTVGSAFAALFMVQGYHQPWWVLAGMVFLTASLGVFLAIPMKRQMINQDQLPFPSGIAAAETLRSLYSEGRDAMRKARSLLLGIAVGGVVGILKNLGSLAETFSSNALGKIAGWISRVVPIPDLLPFPNKFMPNGIRSSGFGFEPGVLMIGAGMIIGLRMALSMLLGSVLLTVVLAPIITNHDITFAALADYKASMWHPGMEEVIPRRWGVWGGTALMVFSSLTSFALQWRTLVRALQMKSSKNVSPVAHLEVPMTWLWIGLVPITIGLVILLKIAFNVGFILGLFAVAMSFVLSLVACRATGEADTTPVGAMGKVTQLIYAMLARNNTVVNLMAAGTTASAAGSAADLLTDLKSGYLLGANPRQQFLAQFSGVFFGTLSIVPAWYALAPSVESLTKRFPMPSANAWKAMADLLANGVGELPHSSMWAVLIGGMIGIVLPIIEAKKPSLSRFLPSAMGLGLGFVVDFSNSLGFAIGAVIAWMWVKRSAGHAGAYSIPLASGLVAGESLFAAIIAILCAVAGLIFAAH
ncbi:MAG: OPT family oligopeptide transporter [Verrucomicrobiota bacterium]